MNLQKTYFHELSQNEIDKIISDKKTIGDIMESYSQPDWCGYYNALAGVYGCWSLMDLRNEGHRAKISREFCSGCEYCKNQQKP